MRDKSIKIKILEKILGIMSRTILWRYKTCVVAITGSVGKTTSKDVIVHILEKHKKIYYTKNNYNNEIGVPLTVLGIDEHIDSVFVMFQVIFVWIKKIIYCQYPEVIIVEFGIDRVGDMDYLTKIAPPDIAILTAISYAHSEFFKDIDEIKAEKQKIITNLKRDGIAVINYDDENVRSVMGKAKAKIITYGTNKEADFIASDTEICFYRCHETGISFKLNYKEKIIPVRLDNIIAKHFIYAILSGIVVADILDINVIDVIKDIHNFQSSKGRMRLLKSNENILIIDDTYNASPKSMRSAIKTLKEIPGKKKVVVLGDMRELGSISNEEHIKIANQLNGINVVFLVGDEMELLYDKLKKDDLIVRHYKLSTDAIDSVANYINNNNIDVVLIKGSRGIHMEYIVKELVSDYDNIL